MTLRLDNLPEGGFTVDIYDRFGSGVYSRKVNEWSQNEMIIPVNDLPSDIYMIAITSGERRVVKKIVIQH
jgi:hypothetical protein